MIKDRIWTLVSRKLSNEATPSELSELDQLIKSESNADLYLEAIDEFWKTPPESDDEFLEATYHLHLNRLKEKGFDLEEDKEKEAVEPLYFDYGEQRAHPIRKKLIILASILSVIAICFYIYYNSDSSKEPAVAYRVSQSEVSTKTGSRTRIQLPDGSTVSLNGGSKLVYDNLQFGKTTREVTLVGEGYFDVAKNNKKPFIIHANRIDIKVVGTTFNVRAYPGEKNTETSLIMGSIEVTMKNGKEKFVMKPNDKLIISNEEQVPEEPGKAGANPVASRRVVSREHLTLTQDENSFVETAWVENKLVFDKESFEEVALKMERWYGVSIRFSDERLKTQKLTGSFEKETVTEALQALQISMPFFKYSVNNQNINIFK